MIPLIIQMIESPEDRELMEDIYESCRRLMYSEIKKLVSGPEEMIEDLLHSSVEKMIRHIDKLKEIQVNKRTSYVCEICRNTAIDFLRKRNPVEYRESEELDRFESSMGIPELFLLKKEEDSIIKLAWDQLDEKHRRVLSEKYILRLSDQEIAKDLGIGKDSVRTTVGRARNAYRKKLSEVEAARQPHCT